MCRTSRFISVFSVLCLLSFPALASKTVTSATVTEGETAIEGKSEYTVDHDSDRAGAWKQKIAVSHGFTDFWQSEIEANISQGGAPGDDTELSNIDWKNKFQFTGQDRYGVDTGMRLIYSFSGTGGADEIEVKFLGAKDFTKFSHRGNLILSREVGEDAGNAVDWGLSWSSRYKYSDHFQPGFELHSDFGEIGDEGEFDEQDHRLGPVFYGRLGKGFSYDAGYLFGVSDRAPDGTVKAIVKYKW